MKNFLNKKISIALIVIFLFSLVLFLDGEKDLGKDVINVKNNEVIKNQDIIKDVNIANREMVQIRFSWEVDGFKYNDAINIPKDQYEKYSAEEIERIKQERFENWIKIVNEQSKTK